MTALVDGVKAGVVLPLDRLVADFKLTGGELGQCSCRPWMGCGWARRRARRRGSGKTHGEIQSRHATD